MLAFGVAAPQLMRGPLDVFESQAIQGGTSGAMKLPNASRATIDAAKLRDYLLSPAHPVGRFKAPFFAALGYSQHQ